MGKAKDEADNIWETDAQGNAVRMLSPGGMGPAIGNDPKLPGALAGQSLQNTKTAQDIANNPLTVANAQTNLAQGQNSIRQSQIGNVQELRKEFNNLPEVKNYSEVLTQMSKAIRAPKGPQGDLAVIYAFAKAMDPGSVVREGEMDMANSTASVVAQFKQKYKSFAEGKGLPPEVRLGLTESIRASGRAMNEAYKQQYARYRDQAAALGADPQQVVGPHLGHAFHQIEQEYVNEHGGHKDAPGINLDANGNAILQDRGRGVVRGSDTGFIGEKGGSHTEEMPGMAGSDAAVNAMLKARRPLGEITGYLKSRGMQDRDIAGVIPQYLAIQQFQKQNPDYQGDFNVDVERREVPNSTVQNFINSDVGTGGALGLNALGAGIPSAMAGNQDAVAAARDAHPMSSLAGEVGGAVGGTLGLNKALGMVPQLAARPGAKMLAADLGYGGAFGATQNPEHPLMGAAMGMGASAAGNAVGRFALGPALRFGGDRLGLGAPALQAGESMVAGQALKADPSEIVGRLRQASDLNMPYSLADADPRLRSLAGSAVRKSPDAFALAAETVGPRGMGQADRAIDLVKSNLAEPLDLPTFKAGAKTSAQTASRDIYARAEAHPSPDDAALNEMLRTPAGEQASRSAYARALNNGEKPGDLSFEVDSITGEPRITGQPNWRTLHYIKMEMDQMPEAGSLSRRFVSRMGTLNKDYRAANATYAKEIRKGDIAQSGYDAFNSRVSTPQLSADIGVPRNAQNLGLYRQGFSSAMTDSADKARLSADPYNIVFGSPRQQSKLNILFPGGAQKFAAGRGLESDMTLTNRELLGGSPTQPRAEADKMFEGGAIDGAMDFGLSLATGTPPISLFKSKMFAGRGLFGGLQDAYRMGVGKSAKHKADQMAPILLDQNPAQAASALEEMMRQQALRDAYVRRTGMFGSAVGAPVAIGLSAR